VSPIDTKTHCARLNGGHFEAPPEPPPGSGGTDAPAGAKSGLAKRLETVCSRAVEKLDEILRLPLNSEDPAFAPVLRAQTGAANIALTTQAKVDETALRKQSVDRMPEIMRPVAEVERKLPPPGPNRFRRARCGQKIAARCENRQRAHAGSSRAHNRRLYK
jgi:hypothetical protein